MKIFKASLNKKLAYAVGFLLLLWALIALFRIDDVGIGNSVKAMLIIMVWALVFTYGLVKQTYLAIDNDKVKFVSYFFSRKTANILDIKIVTTSVIAGFIEGLCIIHYPNGREKLLQISPAGFSKQTLNDFVEELRKINPRIEIHKSAEELLEIKSKKSLPRYQTKGLIGAVISIAMIFVGILYNKNIPLLALFIPLGVLSAAFCFGYGMKGKVKDGFRLLFYFLIFSLIVVLLNFLR